MRRRSAALVITEDAARHHTDGNYNEEKDEELADYIVIQK